MDIKELWYSLGSQFVDLDRLELLTDDRGVMHMLNIARLNDEVHLYVVHNMMEPEIIEMIDWVGGYLDDEGDVATQVEEAEVVGNGELGTEMVEGEGDAHEADGEVHTELGTKMVEGEGDVECHTEVGIEMVEGAHEGDGEDAEVHQVEDGKVHHVEEAEVHDFELEDLGEDDDVEDSEGEDVHEAETEDEDLDDEEVDVSEESLIDVSIQCDIGTSKGNVRQEPCSLVLESSRSTNNVCIHDVRGLSDNEWLSEELISGSDSEDNDGPPTVEVHTAQSAEQTEVTQPPPTDVPITQESTMLGTDQCPEQPEPSQPSATQVSITHETTTHVSDE
ncbi:hypothetical protein LR48_Vigan05g162400 [Vigna angularis]|uniref:Uncharacterized protein n=1 Tax=Phaseolus angularis TaxID=3914 RepID=A0A0L9UNC0_PHAAN|nr:hypothetical protein LR48_Vigan05g162400 [Vigna angularis]